MTIETLFTAVNAFVLPGWVLLALAPDGRWARRLVHSGFMSLVLSGVYLVIVLLHFRHSPGEFGSLSGVGRLFSNPYLLLAGWTHYLAFDLWIGGWIVREARRIGIRSFYVIPCLIFTLLLGPIGFLAFFALRSRYLA